MITTSAGLRPDPKQFLTEYSEGVEQAIRDLQRERIPSGFEQLAKGEVPEDVKSKYQAGVIKV
jgi:hypothetical protein